MERLARVQCDLCRVGRKHLPEQTAPYDIISVISEVAMEQILIRNLPLGTKAALKSLAERNHRSVEAEARDLLATALRTPRPTLPDLLAMPDGVDIDFDPQPLGLTARGADL